MLLITLYEKSLQFIQSYPYRIVYPILIAKKNWHWHHNFYFIFPHVDSQLEFSFIHTLRHHVIIVIIRENCIRFVHTYIIWRRYCYGTNVTEESEQRNECTFINMRLKPTHVFFFFKSDGFPWARVICIHRYSAVCLHWNYYQIGALHLSRKRWTYSPQSYSLVATGLYGVNPFLPLRNSKVLITKRTLMIRHVESIIRSCP